MAETKIAIVTGAGRGIGAAIARELSARGYRLALMSPSGSSSVLAKELGAVAVDGSATKLEDVKQLVALTVATYGRVDAVVNNTGHVPWSARTSGPPYDPAVDVSPTDVPDEDWSAAFEMMVMNVVRMSREVTPIMRKQGGGAIVNISSFTAPEPRVAYPLSSSIRLTLAGFVKLYADRHARDGIRMNSVLPGFLENWPFDDRVKATVPMARPGRLVEVAKTVAFLLSDDASYVTGQSLLVDGGVTRHI